MRAPACAVIAVSFSVVVLVGCGSEATSAPISTTAAPRVSSTGEQTTSTTRSPPTAPTTTVAPAPTLFFADPTAATEHLVNAWKAGNRDEAHQGALPRAVDDIFSLPDASRYFRYSCDSGEFSTSICNYRNRPTSGYVQITAERKAQGWQVTGVTASIDG